MHAKKRNFSIEFKLNYSRYINEAKNCQKIKFQEKSNNPTNLERLETNIVFIKAYYSIGRTNQGGRSNRGNTVIQKVQMFQNHLATVTWWWMGNVMKSIIMKNAALILWIAATSAFTPSGNREPETQHNARPLPWGQARQNGSACIGCLDSWPCKWKQIPSLRSPIETNWRA